MQKISVITPSYNQCEFLEETIKSILNQDYPNLEFIVIDGGSSDKSVKIIEKYERRINYWVSEPDRGQSHAINKGFSKATGDIITWLNSDDFYAENILLNLPIYFSDKSTVLVYGLTKAFGRGNRNEPLYGNIKDNSGAQILGKMTFSQPSSFMKKEALEKAGYLDERLHYGMDYDLFLRLFLLGRFEVYPELLAYYRFHPASKSSNSHINFARDWAFSFSKLLRTFDESSLIKEMTDLGLYHDMEETYNHEKIFDKKQLKTAFLYFLNEQAQAYYGDRSLKKSHEIAKFIKSKDAFFFRKMNLNSILVRSKYVPKSIYKFFD